MAKRPQRSSGQQQSYGVPEQITSVQASPVNTFVAPGREGMPAAPVQSAMPVQPSNQAAIDMQNLSRSFGMLSTALGQLGQAQTKGDQAMLNWGQEQAELVDLQKSQRQTELAFATAVDQGYVDAIDHPAAQKGLARGIARRIDREMDENYKANWESWGLTEPEFRNSEWVRNKFDKDTQSVLDNIPAGVARPDIFQHEFAKARSRSRARWAAKHDEYMNALVLNEAETGLVTTTQDIITESLSIPREPGVVFGTGVPGVPGVPVITPESDEDYRDRQIEFINSRVLELLDGEQGQPFVPKVLNRIIGKAMVDVAENATTPMEAEIALTALKSQMTGPPGSRGNLLSGETQVYFEDREQQILSNMQQRTSAAANRSFRQVGDAYVDSLVNQWGRTLFGDQTGMSSQELSRKLGEELIPSGTSTTIEGVGTIRNVGPDQYALYPDESTGATQPYQFSAKEIARRAIDDDYRRRVQIHRDNGEEEAVALAKAMVDQQQVRPEVKERLRGLPRLMSSARLQHDAAAKAGELDGWESPHLTDLQEGYEMYRTVSELSPYMLDEMLPVGSAERTLLEMVDVLRTSELTGLYTGGTDFPEIYRTLVELGTQPPTQADFERDWKGLDTDFRTTFNESLGNIEGLGVINRRKVASRIQRVALGLYQLGVMDPEAAIEAATENYRQRSQVIGGSRVLNEDAPPPELVDGSAIPDVGSKYYEGDYSWLPITEAQRQEVQLRMGFATRPLQGLGAFLEAAHHWATTDDVGFMEAMGQSYSGLVQDVITEMKEGLPGPRDLTLNETLELAAARFIDNHGPDRSFFEDNALVSGTTKARMTMTEGHHGLLYDVEIWSEAQNMWIMTDTTLTLGEVVAFSKRDAPATVDRLIGMEQPGLALIPEGMEAGKDYFRVPKHGWYSREQMKQYRGEIRQYVELSHELRVEDGEVEYGTGGPSYDS